MGGGYFKSTLPIILNIYDYQRDTIAHFIPIRTEWA